MTDGGTRFALPDPTKRHRTKQPGITFRLTVKGERRYSIDYKDSNGKRVFKTVEGGIRDAQRERNLILERMHRGEKVVRSRFTVAELAEDYLRTQTGHLKPKTLSDYGYALDHWVLPRLGHYKIVEVDVNVVADFVAEMRQEFSSSTVRNCLKPLSRMFQYASRRGWTSINPVGQLDRQEMPKFTAKRMRILTTEEIQQVLAVTRKGYQSKDKLGRLSTPTKGEYHLLLLTAIFTGLRKGELLALDWSDVDLNLSELRVRAGKTAAATRTVVLPAFLVQALAAEMKTAGRVFPFEERNCGRALETALEKAGVEHLRFHDLRHTFASILISMGCDLTYIAQQIGHSSPATTLKVYAHLFDGQKRQSEAKAKMQESFKEIVR